MRTSASVATPTYLQGKEPDGHPRIRVTSAITSELHRIGIAAHFWRLALRSEASPKSLRIDAHALRSLSSGSMDKLDDEEKKEMVRQALTSGCRSVCNGKG